MVCSSSFFFLASRARFLDSYLRLGGLIDMFITLFVRYVRYKMLICMNIRRVYGFNNNKIKAS